jgi:hypothetical protein
VPPPGSCWLCFTQSGQRQLLWLLSAFLLVFRHSGWYLQQKQAAAAAVSQMQAGLAQTHMGRLRVILLGAQDCTVLPPAEWMTSSCCQTKTAESICKACQPARQLARQAARQAADYGLTTPCTGRTAP